MEIAKNLASLLALDVPYVAEDGEEGREGWNMGEGFPK